jgi:type II secretory pathway predicted ATPase ExeA
MPTSTKPASRTLRQLAEQDERVFPLYPQAKRYFAAGSMEDARQRLTRAVERGDGPTLVIGAPGTGKSLLLQVLAAQFFEEFNVALPACARLCTRRALLQSILFELGLPYRSRDEGELRLSLLDHLLSEEECPSGLLLLIDEAQTMPIALLDELRVLTNLVRGDRPSVRLVLAGSSSLEECFANPELESFSQRLAARCYIAPFRRDETAQYIRAQLGASGAMPDEIFAIDAYDAVFEATDGVPRLVNQLCDRALLAAKTSGRSRIERDVIQNVWADLQQLPAPWETPAPGPDEESSQVIEFGNLASEPVSAQTSIAYATIEEMPNTTLDAVEDNELDAEAELAESVDAGDNHIVKMPQKYVAAETHSDPFAEKFDDEEVVLDNFAAWDNMFRRDTPRVANRRDPEFAALVNSAIQQATQTEDIDSQPPAPTVADVESRYDELEDLLSTMSPPAFGPAVPGSVDWPPLRLAVVADSPAAAAPSTITSWPAKPNCAAQEYASPEARAYDWPTEAIGPLDELDDTAIDEEEPVLVIEEEPAVTGESQPPARRADYRHLFSQLRGG